MFPLSLELITYLLLSVTVFSFVLLVLVLMLMLRLNKLMRGKSASSLEETIGALVHHADNTDKTFVKIAKTLEHHDTRLQKSVVEPHTIRFDAFHGTGEGGKQSFATALVSEDGNGMVLSSMYARDMMRIYAKPITNFSSQFELSEEERAVLERAKK